MKINSAIKNLSLVKHCAFGFALATVGFSASAASLTYANPGTENPTEYTFTATETGDILAYFLSNGGAEYTDTLGITVNGVATGVVGLNNQTSSFGDSLNLGFAHAGDTIVFTLNVLNTGNTWYSNKASNTDGSNHVYSTTLNGIDSPFKGTYVAFEDLAKSGDAWPSDFNYKDEQVLVTNVTAVQAVPIPAGAWLFGSGLLGLAGVTRRRNKSA